AGLFEHFDCIVTPDRTGKRKPEPDPFLFALRHMGVTAEETILVGDSMRRDIQPARNLGMVTAYAAYGDRFFEEGTDYSVDYILRSPQELLEILGFLP
ncbi:MAG TPA: HAD family hydrolase, partial [Methanomicrobiales archaeon]|nr:HAD family hydrolase [Methanomicrobiales archaeon]